MTTSTALPWLLHTPPSDQNFRNALNRATPHEIQTALEYTRSTPGNKSRVHMLERRLRKLEKASA